MEATCTHIHTIGLRGGSEKDVVGVGWQLRKTEVVGRHLCHRESPRCRRVRRRGAVTLSPLVLNPPEVNDDDGDEAINFCIIPGCGNSINILQHLPAFTD